MGKKLTPQEELEMRKACMEIERKPENQKLIQECLVELNISLLQAALDGLTIHNAYPDETFSPRLTYDKALIFSLPPINPESEKKYNPPHPKH